MTLKVELYITAITLNPEDRKCLLLDPDHLLSTNIGKYLLATLLYNWNGKSLCGSWVGLGIFSHPMGTSIIHNDE